MNDKHCIGVIAALSARVCVFIHAHVGALNRPVLTLAANSLWSTLGSIGQHFQWGHLPSSSLPHTCSPLFLPPLPPSLQAIGSNTPHRCSQAQTVAAGEGDFFFFFFFNTCTAAWFIFGSAPSAVSDPALR